MKILNKFQEFLKENGNKDTFYKASSFFASQKDNFAKEATQKYEKKNFEDWEIRAKAV